MRGLLILILLSSIVAFMLPLIMGFVVIMAIAACVLMLLAKLGLFRGGTRIFRTYTYTTRRTQEPHRPQPQRKVTFEEEPTARDASEDEVWYQSTQEGEMITLPETALKKEGEEKVGSA